MFEQVDCNLCGSDKYEVIWDKEDRKKNGYLNSKIITIDGQDCNMVNVQCLDCGLVYIRDRLTVEAMDKYYAEEYRNNYKLEHIPEAQHAFMAIKYISNIKGIKKSLDVGCGSGILVEQLSKNRIDAHGIDLNDENFGYANLEKVSLFNYNEKDFDLITILNTLEHMHNPFAALARIRGMLGDEGHLLVTVPNLYNNLLTTSADGFLSNAHLYTFDVQSITNYMNICGFEIERLSLAHEENMQKIYLLVKKGDVRDINVLVKPEPEILHNMFRGIDFAFLSIYDFHKKLEVMN